MLVDSRHPSGVILRVQVSGYIFVGVEDNGRITGVPLDSAGGRGGAKRWLEDVIPGLLRYRFTSFVIHTVEPDKENSEIEDGKVVLVIEVKSSPLAPHQTAHENSKFTYYQRIGSKSVPATHDYLSLLWGRQTYPSKEVAQAWLYSFLNHFIKHLKGRYSYFYSRKYTFDDTDPHGINISQTLNDEYRGLESLPNAQQFFEHYSELQKTLLTHRYEIEQITGYFGQITHQIKESEILQKVCYQELPTNSFLIPDHYFSQLRQEGDMKHASALKVLDKLNDNQFKLDEVLLSGLEKYYLLSLIFDTPDYKEWQLSSKLANYIAYELVLNRGLNYEPAREIPRDKESLTYWFWFKNKHDYINAARSSDEVNSLIHLFDQENERICDVTMRFQSELTEKRNELEQKHGLPRAQFKDFE